MAERRELTFASLDDVMPEVERLLAGHVTVCPWTLGQICNHLATSFHLMLEGGRETAPSSELVPEAIRKRFFRRGKFPDGAQAPHPALLPKPGLDDRAEAENLRAALERFAQANGPFAAHPMLGTLSKEEWDLFHRMHIAHHLGFAVPLPG